MFSLEKFYSSVLPIFNVCFDVELFVLFLYSYITPLSVIYFLPFNIMSFHFFMVSFAVQKLLILTLENLLGKVANC